jgi:hypothetical protein
MAGQRARLGHSGGYACRGDSSEQLSPPEPCTCPIRVRSKGQTRALMITRETSAMTMTCIGAGPARHCRSLPSWSGGFDSLRPLHVMSQDIGMTPNPHRAGTQEMAGTARPEYYLAAVLVPSGASSRGGQVVGDAGSSGGAACAFFRRAAAAAAGRSEADPRGAGAGGGCLTAVGQ